MNFQPLLISVATDGPSLFPESTPAEKGTSAFIFLIGGLFVVGLMIFWFWMLLDCLSKPVQNKALWILCMLFGGPIVSIIYFFIGRNNLIPPVVQPVANMTPPIQPAANMTPPVQPAAPVATPPTPPTITPAA